jgi:hypothetical protein
MNAYYNTNFNHNLFQFYNINNLKIEYKNMFDNKSADFKENFGNIYANFNFNNTDINNIINFTFSIHLINNCDSKEFFKCIHIKLRYDNNRYITNLFDINTKLKYIDNMVILDNDSLKFENINTHKNLIQIDMINMLKNVGLCFSYFLNFLIDHKYL